MREGRRDRERRGSCVWTQYVDSTTSTFTCSSGFRVWGSGVWGPTCEETSEFPTTSKFPTEIPTHTTAGNAGVDATTRTFTL